MKALESALPIASRPAPAWSFRWLARCVVALAAIAAFALTVAWTFGPERFGMEQAQYVPFPLFALPAILAVAISWRLGFAWRAAAVVSLASIATIVMGFQLHFGDRG